VKLLLPKVHLVAHRVGNDYSWWVDKAEELLISSMILEEAYRSGMAKVKNSEHGVLPNECRTLPVVIYLRTLGKVQFGRIVLDSLNSHTVSRLREAKSLSRPAARSFAQRGMTGLDLAGGEELSSSFEPCLSD